MLFERDTGRQIESSAGNAGGIAVESPPEQIPATDVAEAAFGRGRGLVPGKSLRCRELEVLVSPPLVEVATKGR